MRPILALIATVFAMTSAAAQTPDARAHPERWPTAEHARPRDPAIEARIDALLARMTVEDKVGQLIQVDIASIQPGDIGAIRVGSVLNGGNSKPGGGRTATLTQWLTLADAFWTASMAPLPGGRPSIPMIWGTDAVHGDNNVTGATLFPHNIGLGAARDRDLIRRIGEVTAAETAATGIDWSFAPTLAVVQDDRWGRTYESYSEEPSIVADYAGAMIEGLQGRAGTPEFMRAGHVIATAKHFLGDGGTGGHDQGDTRVSEGVLRDVHGAGYPPAIGAGALTVMASFSSWNGEKMHGNASLLTGVLKQRLGFDGLLVGDWNAHGQLPGCTDTHCPAAINAGLDMFMMSGDWRALYRNTLADVRAGAIPAARLDDAVRRILRVKLIARAFDAKPSARATAGRFELIGAPAHRAIAREAVRRSLVLLKNEGGLLPLRPQADILVAGRGADSIARQSGGWTITWQGTDVSNADFPNGQSIWSGIAEQVRAAGGEATLSVDGRFDRKPDAAIIVFGETPYAEFQGDRPSLEYAPEDKADLALLRRLKAAGVPVVAVFLSGRPMWVNAHLNTADAFVAAFLPGTEGGGVADVLLRAPGGKIAHDFTGRLSFSWPKRPDQFVLNRRDRPYDPLFAFGYGLSYAVPAHVAHLDERLPAGLAADAGPLFGRGRVPPGYVIEIADAGSAAARLAAGDGHTAHLNVTGIDRRAQEDARRLTWNGRGPAELRIVPAHALDLHRETGGELSLVLDYRLGAAPASAVELAMLGADGKRAAAPIGGPLRAATVATWATLAVPLRCFAARGLDMARVGVPFVLATSGALTIDISDVRIASVAGSAGCGGE